MEPNILERWISQYQDLIFSLCFRLVEDYFDAQDLTQETFLAAYRSLADFDGRNEKAWLTRIATNKCLDYRRQAARRLIPTEDTNLHVLADTGPASESHSSSPPETIFLEQEARRQLYDRCAALKAPYDEVALAYFYEERSVEDIAKRQKKKKKTVQTQIYRARELLRQYYRKEMDSG